MGQLVILAYSGGLNTSAIVPWLREARDAQVWCYAADDVYNQADATGFINLFGLPLRIASQVDADTSDQHVDRELLRPHLVSVR